jgi:hypothetical protein
MSMRVVTVLAILLALVAAAALRWGVSRWQSQPTAPLELSLSVSKKSFLIGEPVKIQMQVRNETKDELKLQFRLGFGCANDLIAAISSDGGKTFQPYTSMATLIGQREFCLVPPFTLKSGEERKGEEFIGFHVVSVDFMTNKVEGDFAFPKAGKYQVKMTLTPRPLTGILESNVVEVEVVEPEGKDKEALQFIVDNQLKPFLTPEAVLFPVENETIQKLQQFLEKFTDGAYAPYVKVGLEAICRERREQLPACQK